MLCARLQLLSDHFAFAENLLSCENYGHNVFILIVYLQAFRSSQNPLLSIISLAILDELLESTVDGRAEVRHALIEIDSGNSTLGDALRSELELL